RPDRAILKMLLLPDWNRLLQRINEPAASVKSRSSMGRGHGNGYDGFADLKLPQAMYHPNIPHFKTFKCSLRQPLHLIYCHGVIRFVIKEECTPAVGVIPHHPVKHDHGAIFR